MDAQSATIERLLRERVWVRRLARALVRDANIADDLAQQAYLAALESPSTAVRSPRAWLATVVKNLARDRTRAEQRRTRREKAQRGVAPIPPPDVLAARAEMTDRVARYVLELEEPYRETILLRFYEDLPPREIAAHMGVPVETVRTRTKRAVARLASRLDSDHGGDRRAWAAPLLLLRQPLGWTEAGVTIGGIVAMKKVLALGAVVLVVLMGAVIVPTWMAGPDAPPAAEPHAVREEQVDPDTTSQAALHGTAEDAEESASLAMPDRARWGIMGRVVRRGRVPVAGAVLLAMAVAFKPYALAWLPGLLAYGGLVAPLAAFVIASAVAWLPALVAFGPREMLWSFREADALHGPAYYSLAFALEAPESVPKPLWNGLRVAIGVGLAIGNLLFVRSAPSLIIGGALVFGATLFLGWWGSFAYFAAVAPVLCWHLDDWLGLQRFRVVWPTDPVRRVTTWADTHWPVRSDVMEVQPRTR